MNNRRLIDQLQTEKQFSHAQWCQLIATCTEEDRAYAHTLAEQITLENFGTDVYFRGIIEFSNICSNDCLYCGIRKSNPHVDRYLMSQEDILLCCEEGYRLGYRTFVLQGGENPYRESPAFLSLIRTIREKYPDCAITLSVGECRRETYEAMYEAGADRYLLRHETADEEHYGKLHPKEMSFRNRMRCLYDLRDIGFQTGCGIMVGTPHQTVETLAKDMIFMGEFRPAMVGIGPFLPHKDTPFADCTAGSRELTLFLMSLTRILLPRTLLPATTALQTQGQKGRILGVKAGCNVVMPNLSPQNVKKNYLLYDNKFGTEIDAETSLQLLKEEMASIGRTVVTARGDYKNICK